MVLLLTVKPWFSSPGRLLGEAPVQQPDLAEQDAVHEGDRRQLVQLEVHLELEFLLLHHHEIHTTVYFVCREGCVSSAVVCITAPLCFNLRRTAENEPSRSRRPQRELPGAGGVARLGTISRPIWAGKSLKMGPDLATLGGGRPHPLSSFRGKGKLCYGLYWRERHTGIRFCCILI